ncbi:unnamed protein product, partial [Didymodactylos carnosus]
PSSPDYQHSPSISSNNSNTNNNPHLMAQSTTGGVYDKVTPNDIVANNQRTLLLSSKPNLRSFTVPVAPPVVPPLLQKQQVHVQPNIQNKPPFRSPNRAVLATYSKGLNIKQTYDGVKSTDNLAEK